MPNKREDGRWKPPRTPEGAAKRLIRVRRRLCQDFWDQARDVACREAITNAVMIVNIAISRCRAVLEA